MVTAVIWTRLSKPPDTRSAHGCWKQRRRDAQAVERPETPLPLKRAQTVGLDDDGGGSAVATRPAEITRAGSPDRQNRQKRTQSEEDADCRLQGGRHHELRS